ncbi:glycosyltransferase family 87 protein [Mycobacterium riyadhense]|uniref:DUF2029 domain-containing protein n=1 Tax=Mycobacterium riyadhense TaxID=486698 RepID=A0A1X2BW79_9MYCO|nr:glycosyltransferase family 87 protein [Mycobacterium riyadhense]MCV7149199.1 DUF2029 domain-containing protein [Mycobacterium riyadhense]ORW67955.1 hypothetical protein AWC22_27165 [Mycobacterium riyadhense]
MKRPVAVVRGVKSAIRQRYVVIVGQSERSLLLGIVLVATTISVVTGFVLTQYYSIDVPSSLIFVPHDCYLDWGMNVGRHCFSDYTMPVTLGLRSNPWEPYPAWTSADHVPFQNNYPPAGMVPHMAFGLLGQWLHAPRIGLLGYLLALSMAVFSPAAWASRSGHGYERLVIFIACGIAAIPAWMAIDRGNSVGFVVPIALVYLVALCRGRWRLAAIMIILAALVKPQFVVLAVVLFAARQWRWGGIAVAGSVFFNFAAYLLWPHDFPQTVMQSMHGTVEAGAFQRLVGGINVSFGRVVLLFPDYIAARANGGTIPDGFLLDLRSLVGYVILVGVVAAVIALGRRIPPVMAGIVVLTTASLFPALTHPYYLVFALPIAALVVRDPDGPPGSGIFDRYATVGGRRRAVGVLVTIATALSIAHMIVPGSSYHGKIVGQLGLPGIEVVTEPMLSSTLLLVPILWLIATVAVIVSYLRKPACVLPTEPSRESEEAPDSWPPKAELIAELRNPRSSSLEV